MRITTKKNLSALWSPLQSENKTLSEKREHVNMLLNYSNYDLKSSSQYFTSKGFTDKSLGIPDLKTSQTESRNTSKRPLTLLMGPLHLTPPIQSDGILLRDCVRRH